MSSNSSTEFHVFHGDWGGVHVVSAATIARAFAAEAAAAVPADDDLSDEDDSSDDEEIEDLFTHIIETAEDDELPSDLVDTFCEFVSPMFVEYEIRTVPENRLGALVAALRARGMTVVE